MTEQTHTPNETTMASTALDRTEANLELASRLSAKFSKGMEELKERQKEQQKETDRRMQETDRRMQETDRQMQETDRRLKKAENMFTTKWSRFLESLVEGDLVPLLKERSIAVERTLRNMTGRRNGEHFEVDIVAANGVEVVVVEVKTTLRPRDVKRFLAKLGQFREWCPEYRRHTIFGAVAYLKADASVCTHAERQGLFVIRATGKSASITNEPDFRPRAFS